MTDEETRALATGAIKRIVSEADYYCPTDADDEHEILGQMTLAEMRAIAASLDRLARAEAALHGIRVCIPTLSQGGQIAMKYFQEPDHE